MKILKKISQKTAQAPGTLDYVGDKPVAPIRISVLDYDELNYSEKTIDNIDEKSLGEKPFMRWLNIDGVYSPQIIETIGAMFDLHPLMLEDVMHTGQRPKIDGYNNCLFFIFKMIYLDEKKNEIISEQISLVVGKDYLISFQEEPGDVFNPVRDRIKNTRWREKKLGSDYLAYALLDAVVDHYFILLEKIDEQTEMLDQELNDKPTTSSLNQIHHLKKEIIFLRKSIWPLREMISELQRNDHPLIKDETKIYFKDINDHVIQVIDVIESFRDILTGLQDLYLSSISNRMNEVMKVLTIVATIFIPPTFIAGIYGMNFEVMPELKWPWGYAAALLTMLTLISGMLIFFKRKKWI